MLPIKKEITSYPQPDGTNLEVIKYIFTYLDKNVNKIIETSIQFYPNNGATISKAVNAFYSVSVTLIKEDVEALLQAFSEEKVRYDKEEIIEEDVPDVFKSFLGGLKE